MDAPETEPVYFAPTETAPNLIAPRCTLPPMLYVPCGLESVIDPLSRDRDSFQMIVNVP